jgi:hypothetical protein
VTRNRVRQPRRRRQLDMPRGSASRRYHESAPLASYGHGCERPPIRPCARRCRPPWEARRDRLPPTIQSAVHIAGVGPCAKPGKSLAGRPSRSGGQTGAALEPASLDDRPARAGGHAVTEPVPLRPLSVVGLESSLHSSPPRSRQRYQSPVHPGEGDARQPTRPAGTASNAIGVPLLLQSRGSSNKRGESASTPIVSAGVANPPEGFDLTWRGR